MHQTNFSGSEHYINFKLTYHPSEDTQMLIHFTYIFFNIMIALTYIHYSIDDLSNMHALKHSMYVHFHMYDFDTTNS